MINPKIAEEDIRIIDEYIRDLFDQIQDGRTAEQAVCMDYSAVFGKNSEESFVFVQDILTAKKEYELHKETALRELPEQYLEQFIAEQISNPDYTVSQKYQILAMAKAYFLKISCISLGDALLKDELGLSFETAMLAVEAEFSDRMRHAAAATGDEVDALYEEVILASEAALVLPYPLEIAQTISDYIEENILDEKEKESLAKRRDMYLIYTYAVYKAIKLNTLTMKDMEMLNEPEFAGDLLSYLTTRVLAMSDLCELVQEIRGGKTSLEKAQSVIRILVSVLFGAGIACLSMAAVAGTAALIAELYLTAGAVAGTVTLGAVMASILVNADHIADFAVYLCENVEPRINASCQCAAKKLSALLKGNLHICTSGAAKTSEDAPEALQTVSPEFDFS